MVALPEEESLGGPAQPCSIRISGLGGGRLGRLLRCCSFGFVITEKSHLVRRAPKGDWKSQGSQFDIVGAVADGKGTELCVTPCLSEAQDTVRGKVGTLLRQPLFPLFNFKRKTGNNFLFLNK